MLGPVSPILPQVPSAASEPTQTVASIRPADDPRAGTGVELARAARPIPEDNGQRGIEAAISAKENTIRMTEEVARRDRDRLQRYPLEIAGLRDEIAKGSDAAGGADLTKRLGQLETALSAARGRVATHDATWPDARAALEAQITRHKTELAKAGYAQGRGTAT